MFKFINLCFCKTMSEFHEKYFEMLYNYIRNQNEWLLHEIAVRENIPSKSLKKFLPSLSQLRTFIREQNKNNEKKSNI